MIEDKEIESKRTGLWLPREFCAANAGTTSPTPKLVFEAAQKLRLEMAADPVETIWETQLVRIESGRKFISETLNCHPDHLLLIPNSTFAINTLIRSELITKGTKVLMPSQEYSHYLTVWERARAEQQVELITIPVALGANYSAAGFLQQLEDALINQKPDVLFFSHVTSSTGTVLPAKAMVQLARNHNCRVIIDGAHAPGMIPVDLEEIGPDVYFGNIHKWLMGLTGSAFCWVAPEHRASVPPLVTTSFFAFDQKNMDSRPGYGSTNWINSHEYHGTEDRTPLATIPEVFDFRTQIGEDFMRAVMIRNRMQFVEGLARCSDFELVSPEAASSAEFSEENPVTAMVTFQHPRFKLGFDVIKAWRYFRDQGFDLAFPVPDEHYKASTQWIRISLAWFITSEEIENFLQLLGRSIPWDSFQKSD